MRHKGIRILGLALTLFMLVGLLPAAVMAETAEPEIKTIYITHTNDTHGRVIGDDAPGEDGKPVDDGVIGFARYKGVIDALKAANEDMVLALDAGDATHGTNFATLSNGQSVIRLFNDMGIAAMGIGNHDFNYGFDDLQVMITEADFPLLAANVVKEGTTETVFETNRIFEVGGIEIGVFGLATPETKVKSSPVNTEGLEFLDPAEVAAAQVAELEEAGVGAIILLAHLGIDEESEFTSKYVLDQVEGIDLVIDGHSHHEIPDGELYNDSLIVMAGSYLENIGLVSMTFTDGELTETATEHIDFMEAQQYEADAELLASIAAIEEENERFTSVEVGELGVHLDGEREDVRSKETNLGNLITDSMLAATGADVVITNGGGIRASIEAGMITMGDLLTVLPFGNMVTVIDVTGADIKAALEFGASDYPNPAGKFPHVANLTYELVSQDDETYGVQNIMVGGEPLDEAQSYTLATNDFMAIGGDGYTMFEGKEQLMLQGLMVDILRDYIVELLESGEPLEYSTDGRITVVE
jgi:5'-nucleotidase